MAIIYNTSMVRSGLVLHLDAANRKSYPGSGTIWTDLSGNGNDGILTNGPTFNGDNGGSIAFNGTNNYINISHSSTLNITTNNLTIEVVYKSNDLADVLHGDGLISKGNEGSNDGVYELLTVQSNNKNYLYFRCAVMGVHTPTIIPMNINQIYIVSAVLNNGLMITYVNGIAEDSGSQKTGNIISSSSDVTIGTRFLQRGSSSSALNGNIYSTKLYNRALSAAEVRQNFEATRDRYGI